MNIAKGLFEVSHQVSQEARSTFYSQRFIFDSSACLVRFLNHIGRNVLLVENIRIMSPQVRQWPIARPESPSRPSPQTRLESYAANVLAHTKIQFDLSQSRHRVRKSGDMVRQMLETQDFHRRLWASILS